MKKILFYVIMIFLLTGCSINYRLEINDDLSFVEITSFVDSNNNLSKQNNNLDVAFNSLVQYYNSHNGIKPGVTLPNNFKRIVVDNNNSGGALSLTSKNTSNLSKSIYLNHFFDDISIDKENRNILFYFHDFNFSKLEEMLKEKNITIDKLVFRIKCPFEVVNSNHDYYNDNTGEYIWYLKNDLSVRFKFNSYKKINNKQESNNNSGIIGNIIYSATGMEINDENDKKVKNYANLIWYGLGLILFLIIMFYFFRKFKKNDQL